MNPTADEPLPARPGARAPQPRELRTVRQTTCCVVGAGPAGAMLALLLARQRVPVVLLEAHGDFDRDFRGDSLHPAIMQVLDELGLADQLLELPHRKLRQATLSASPPITIDLSRLPGRFPYITLMPQAQFLDFLTTQAARHPAFQLVMRANVRELIDQDGIVRGVRYHAPDSVHEVRATLTVGADGRFSQTRRLSGLTAVTTASSIDVLWLRLPRLPDDPEGVTGGTGRGHMLLLVDRGETWQLGMVIPKGSWPQLRAAGLDALRRTIAGLAPWLTGRVGQLADCTADRLPRWHRPGLLLMGDAAHVMSPVAGNGINYAIADAVAAANLLAARWPPERSPNATSPPSSAAVSGRPASPRKSPGCSKTACSPAHSAAPPGRPSRSGGSCASRWSATWRPGWRPSAPAPNMSAPNPNPATPPHDQIKAISLHAPHPGSR